MDADWLKVVISSLRRLDSSLNASTSSLAAWNSDRKMSRSSVDLTELALCANSSLSSSSNSLLLTSSINYSTAFSSSLLDFLGTLGLFTGFGTCST
jgi:hypothetical protein